MTKVSTKQITLCGMFSALVAVGTMAISVPVPMTNGYVNLGDGFIIVIAYMFGGLYAAFAGAVGSAAADILLGYPHWAFFTFIIKGIMGYAAGRLLKRDTKLVTANNVCGVIITEAIMVCCYFLAGAVIYSSFGVSLSSVPSNIIQGVAAVFVFFVLAGLLRNVNIGR